MVDSFAVLISIGVLIFGVVVGRFLDPEWKVKQMRNVLRRNYVIAGILSKDRRTISDRAVLVEGDAISFAGQVWAYEKGRIWRKDKPDKSIELKDNLKFKEGVPYIFLDSITLRPVDFYPEEATATKADALGAIFSAWIANQMAKAFAAVKRNEMMLIGCVVGIIVALLGLYLIWGGVGGVSESVTAINEKVDVLQSDMELLKARAGIYGSQQNGTIIIQG